MIMRIILHIFLKKRHQTSRYYICSLNPVSIFLWIGASTISSMVMIVIFAQSHLLILTRVVPYSLLIIPSKFKRNWFVSYLFIQCNYICIWLNLINRHLILIRLVFGFVLKFQMLNVLLFIELNDIM